MTNRKEELQKTQGVKIFGGVVSHAFGILAISESEVGDTITELIEAVELNGVSNEEASKLREQLKNEVEEFTKEIFEDSDEAEEVRKRVVADVLNAIDKIVSLTL